jgi:hypothetical protein
MVPATGVLRQEQLSARMPAQLEGGDRSSKGGIVAQVAPSNPFVPVSPDGASTATKLKVN